MPIGNSKTSSGRHFIQLKCQTTATPRSPAGPLPSLTAPLRPWAPWVVLAAKYEINSLHIGMALYKLNLLTLSTPLACCLAYATPPIGGSQRSASFSVA